MGQEIGISVVIDVHIARANQTFLATLLIIVYMLILVSQICTILNIHRNKLVIPVILMLH